MTHHRVYIHHHLYSKINYNPYNVSNEEANSEYPNIPSKVLLLETVAAGGLSNQSILFDTSDLPNMQSESFTLSVSVSSNEFFNISDSGNSTTYLIIMALDQDAIDNQNRVEVYYVRENASDYGKLVFRHAAGFGETVFNTSVDYINKLKDAKVTIAYVWDSSASTASYYLNGIKLGQSSIFDGIDFSQATNPILSLGVPEQLIVPNQSNNYLNLKVHYWGYWKRSLSYLELVHLHNNGISNNPWLNLKQDYYTPMQNNLIQAHYFEDSSFYTSTSNLDIELASYVFGTDFGGENGFTTTNFNRTLGSNYVELVGNNSNNFTTINGDNITPYDYAPTGTIDLTGYTDLAIKVKFSYPAVNEPTANKGSFGDPLINRPNNTEWVRLDSSVETTIQEVTIPITTAETSYDLANLAAGGGLFQNNAGFDNEVIRLYYIKIVSPVSSSVIKLTNQANPTADALLEDSVGAVLSDWQSRLRTL